MFLSLPLSLTHTPAQCETLVRQTKTLARVSDHVSVLQREEKVPGVRRDAFAAWL